MDNIKKEFKNPSSKWRSAPFWSWNGVMDPERLDFQMRDFKAHGIGGGFAHPRLGMVTEYFSEEYFDAWQKTLDTAKREDMKLYMYDENAWPSGFGSGKTVERDPGTVGVLAKYRITDAADPQFGGPLIFAGLMDGNRIEREITETSPEYWPLYGKDKKVLVIYKVYPFESPWTAGYPYADLTNPKTTEIFISEIYDEYYKRFGEDFGTYIPAIFSDEANIHTEGLNTVPFGKHITDKFRELCGYDITPNIPAIFGDFDYDAFEKPAKKIRYDFYYTMHELWIDSFVKPIASWCEEHGVAWTGHDVEHQWPMSHGGRMSPSPQTTYEFRQWPGMDLLLCDHLINEPSNFDKYLMYEIRSAANQFARKRTLSEAYGAGGYQSTLADYKRLGDFLFVGGINLICQHLSLYSYAGYRKRDCPQSFDYRQPWWDEYTEFADYIGRLSYILSQGKMEQRVLLVNASTSSYVIPAEEQIGCVDHELSVDCVKNPDMSDYLTIVNALTDAQWDFDIGDEYSISRHGKTENGKFVLGQMAYDTVVISKNMSNIRRDTAKLLLEFAAAGGNLVTTDGEKESFGLYIDGETEQPETLSLREAAFAVRGGAALCAYLEEQLDSRVKSSAGFPTGVQHMRRRLDDGRVVYFFVNHAMGNTFSTTLSIRAEDAEVWNLFTGEAEAVPYTREGEWVSFPLTLDRCGTALIVTGGGAAPAEMAKADALHDGDAVEAKLTLSSISRECDNTYSIDHVSVDVDGEKRESRYFIEACDCLFESRGFERDPWRASIQKDNDWMDKNAEYGEDSGFTARYYFTVADGFKPARLTAVVERAELYTVCVNGHPVTSEGSDSLDPDMWDFQIAPYVREGVNEITLTCPRFNVLCELEAVFLRGDFAVDTSEDGGFVLTHERPVTYGKWCEQGMSHYPYAVNYSYNVSLEDAPVSAAVILPDHGATAVSVKVNGTYVGVIGRDGGVSLEIGEHLRRGENEVVLRVIGSLRNLLGPHIDVRPFEPYEWNYFPRGRDHKAEEYTFTEYGLYGEPKLLVK